MAVSQPRKVERQYGDARPRDALIQQGRASRFATPAANDNDRVLKTMSGRPTTDEIFTEQYKKQGLQASAGNVVPFRKVAIDYKTRSSVDTGARRQVVPQTLPMPSSTDDNVSTRVRANPIRRALPVVQEAATVLHEADKIKIRAITTSIFSWALWVWSIFQVPIAVLSITFLGAVGALAWVESIVRSTWAGDIVMDSLEWLTAVTSKVVELFGFDLSLLSPDSFFFLTHSAALFIGWGTLLIMGIVYTLSFTACLFGRGAALKIGTLLLAMIGYAIPICNLFPCFVLWAWAVRRYPN